MYKTVFRSFIFCLLLLLNLAANANTSLSKIAIIIDDLGDNLNAGLRVINLPGPVVCSILPHTFYSVMLAEKAHQAGKEVMLHVPMQTIMGHDLGTGGLRENMTEAEFSKILDSDLQAVPHIQGVNNHMGSRLTILPEPMKWLMRKLKSQNLYFIDSKTSPHSIAEKIAYEENVRTMHRDIFLDHVRTRESIEEQFKALITIARRRGYAIAIGHPYAITLNFLEKMLPSLSAQGIELVPISQLLPPVANHKTSSVNFNLFKTKKFSEFICEINSPFCEWIKN